MVDQLQLSVLARLEGAMLALSHSENLREDDACVNFVNSVCTLLQSAHHTAMEESVLRRFRLRATEDVCDIRNLSLRPPGPPGPVLYPRRHTDHSLFHWLDGNGDCIMEVFSWLSVGELETLQVVSSHMRWHVADYYRHAAATLRWRPAAAPVAALAAQAVRVMGSVGPQLRTLVVEGEAAFPSLDVAALRHTTRISIKRNGVPIGAPAALYLGMALAEGAHVVRLSGGACVSFEELRTRPVVLLNQHFLLPCDVALMLGPLSRRSPQLQRVSLGAHNLACVDDFGCLFSWPMREAARQQHGERCSDGIGLWDAHIDSLSSAQRDACLGGTGSFVEALSARLRELFRAKLDGDESAEAAAMEAFRELYRVANTNPPDG